MLTGDTLLRHFRKGMYYGGDRQLHTLISYVLLMLPKTFLLENVYEFGTEQHGW